MEHKELATSLRHQLEKLFYATGNKNEYFGFLDLLTRDLLKEHDNSRVLGGMTVGKLTKAVVHPLGKKGKRWQINVVCTIAANLSKKDLRELSVKRIRDIYGVRVISPTVIEVSSTFSMTSTGSKLGYYGSNRSFDVKTQKWDFDESLYLPIINDPQDVIVKKQNELITLIGDKAFQALKKGQAELCVWRRSQPFNWFIKNKKNNKTLWHSERGERPSMAFFNKKEDSKEVISVPEFGYFRIPGNGEPELTTYKFNNLT